MTTNLIVKFIFSKSLRYELNYLSDKFKPRKLLLIILAIIGGIVVSLDGAQAFFTGKDSPVPQNWTFLKKPFNARGLASAIIVAPYLAIWYSNNRDTEEENQNISQITKKVTLPFFEKNLDDFLESKLRVQFGLSNSARLYIMMPIRTKFGQWHLQVITNTINYDSREKDIRLELDEGFIGYAFQKINHDSRRTLKIMDTDTPNLPPRYKHFTPNNRNLVRPNNKRYVVAPIFDKTFLSSVFIIDTDDPSDLDKLVKPELHDKILDWIGNEPILLSLIWRLKNNGH
jgi:hypothetical protein